MDEGPGINDPTLPAFLWEGAGASNSPNKPSGKVTGLALGGGVVHSGMGRAVGI